MQWLKGMDKYRRRILWGGLALLLTAVAFRVVTERMFLARASVEGAFSCLTPEESTGTVTMTARYLPPAYGFSEEKLLRLFGEKIGLEMPEEFRTVTYAERVELVYEKQAAQATSLIKLVHLPETDSYYLCAEIAVFNRESEEVGEVRERLLRAAKNMKLCEINTTMELCGIYPGEIPLAQKDELTDRLLRELYATPVYENRENKQYTVYAYTGAVKEYIVAEKKKVNVQVAIYYDKATQKTEVILATPLGLR